MSARLLWLLCLLCPLLAQAGLYRYVDEHGNVVYTDRPVPGAEPVRPGTIPIIPAPPKVDIELELEGEPRASEREKPPPQPRVIVERPREDEAVRANDGVVEVVVRLDPAPAEGLRLGYQAYLDGAPHGPVSDRPRWRLEAVARGTHTLEVVVLKGGEPWLRSSPVTFHVLRVSRLIRPR